MESVSISWNKTSLRGTLVLPSSKSISNRLLVMQFLSGRSLPIENLSQAGDTLLMKKLLEQLAIHRREAGTGKVLIMDAGHAGTVFRFLTALLAVIPGHYILTGSERMHQRPIAPLVDALRMIGASVEYLGVTDGSPLRIQGKELEGGVTFLDASLSSQFLSALLMVAPVMRKGLTIQLSENSVSMPYVDMTLSLMNVLGVNAEREHFCIRTRPQVYRPVPVEVEPDWSSASFWFAMAAVSPECKLLIKDLTKRSIQGDAVVRMIFNRLGVRSLFSTEGILLEKSTAEEEFLDLDMAGTPDLVIPFTLACAGLGRKAVIRKIGHLALKESNRLEALKEEMAKLNIRICISGSDTMLIDPSGGVHSPVQPLDPHGDHRLAMAFASLAILFGPVTILDPGVVAKSYPDFWNHLAQVGFELQFTS